MSTKTVEYWKKRLAQLQKIKNPNDYDKHQIESAKTRIQEFQTKRNESLHSSKKPAPKTDRRGRRLKIQPKVDRSSKLPSDYKETEAKARETASNLKKNKLKTTNNKTGPKGNPLSQHTSGQDKNVPSGTATQGGGITNGKESKKDKLKARAKELGLRDNSPAAKAGFSLKERVALREKHNQWKADRKAGKLKIGNKKRKRGG